MQRSRSTLIESGIRPPGASHYLTAMSGLVVDADAHVNEDPFAWNELADLHPGWLTAGQSGGKWVARIGDLLYPTQEGRGRGVPIESATNPACAAGAAGLDQRLKDLDGEGIDRQGVHGGG